MLFACCLCSFRAKEGNSRLLWAYDRPRHTPPPEWLVDLWTPWRVAAATRVGDPGPLRLGSHVKKSGPAPLFADRGSKLHSILLPLLHS